MIEVSTEFAAKSADISVSQASNRLILCSAVSSIRSAQRSAEKHRADQLSHISFVRESRATTRQRSNAAHAFIRAMLRRVACAFDGCARTRIVSMLWTGARRSLARQESRQSR